MDKRKAGSGARNLIFPAASCIQRDLPLYEEGPRPGTWNERMSPGEHAVHYSSFASDDQAPYCTVFENLDAAFAYAQHEVQAQPELSCKIYDNRGFGFLPTCEVHGSKYIDKNAITPGFRRWAGSILFFGGLALLVVEFCSGFSLLWPGVFGGHMIFPGVMFLGTEFYLLMTKSKKVIPSPDPAP
jgi:hypothetical protein